MCNTGFSLDEEYMVALLGCILTGSTDPGLQANPTVKRILNRNNKLRARIEKSKAVYVRYTGEPQTVWKPEADRIERIVVKNARGHVYYEFGEPRLDRPVRVWFGPLGSMTAAEREIFENICAPSLWPEVGSRMMTRILARKDLDGAWVNVQDGIYRYALIHEGALIVRTVLYDYLATEVDWNG